MGVEELHGTNLRSSTVRDVVAYQQSKRIQHEEVYWISEWMGLLKEGALWQIHIGT